ncbi:N-acetyl-beta-glucosaminyl-glycoprotein 4-beta-N-acetylgalactosaminyltransferase 1 [Xenopus tropicalis]|uniref:Beta-1,4-N-acetylgalactosaminyltransferase n=1 Tax=Xenopus tropicalis TaxID=8364 RepID=A0JP97_XENTR|nr:N-acetyl-beta-glucosaminyl-glycoprotein 4-beta-N-acetylgalactosaminyltransferase 1 [Xenopus tropicalis]AAI27315.1 LOC100036642 protein [Xenopus tropicalis]|eukprot:XP_012815815.1 PREDICTED: N-acetyl-beta-glucosaminyl-glycoprotein 4-beta-N-acetylgalactosaminyltransferase 1 isoform X1 [Xenopus tropicalis]
MPWLPVKKIRRQFKLLLLLVLLTSAVWVTYLHISLARQGKTLRLPFIYSRDGERAEGTDHARKTGRAQVFLAHSQAGDSSEEAPTPDALVWKRERKWKPSERGFNLTDTPLPWDEKYKGKVNLHVFEDWCGGSVLLLKTNLHFPLYPHTRTTVTKLAVSPKWKNYGLRLFGYIHPYKDGDFQFAVASEDNSEFWLSSEESPSSAQLIAYVGKSGSEWTAPGEFTKFSSQVSKPIRLMSSRRYYFELLHKQDDHGSDHVEVAWRLSLPGMKFEIVDSAYLSLYTDETALRMNEVAHIPRTLSSHTNHLWGGDKEQPAADMLIEDPRDNFFMTPLIEQSRLENVLVPCAYSPTYVVKDFPIARYQGLQFVYLTFVYPNDFTRLTHMETENKCFYRESPIYLEKFGFYKYMKMDDEESPQIPFLFFNRQNFMEEDDDDEEALFAPRKLNHKIKEDFTGDPMPPNTDHIPSSEPPAPTYRINASAVAKIRGRSLQWAAREYPPLGHRGQRRLLIPTVEGQIKRTQQRPTDGTLDVRLIKEPEHRTTGKSKNGRMSDVRRKGIKSEFRNRARKLDSVAVGPKTEFTEKPELPEIRPTEGGHLESITSEAILKQNPKDTLRVKNKHKPEKVYVTRLLSKVRKSQTSRLLPGMLLHKPKPHRSPSPHAHSHAPHTPKASRGGRRSKAWSLPDTSELGLFSWEGQTERPGAPVPTSPSLPNGPPSLSVSSEAPAEVQEQDYSYEEEEPRQRWPEDAINWQRTFSVGTVDFEMLRSDWNDLRCNVSGNLQLSEAETVDLVAQYMEKLNEKNGGIYTLLHIINVEKRRDSARGNRYFIELELQERSSRKVRLADYVYLLLHRGAGGDSDESPPADTPEVSPSPQLPLYSKPILCRPVSLNWNPRATVHFVVPVKNQARWVQQLISDLEFLYTNTQDDKFNLILVDYDSEDMDVEKALRSAKLPSYKYLKRSGNFERSAGLQAGVDTIQDNHSIVFLCDLHIHFPLSVLDSVRKHCVEGRLAFAPIVMRLACGSSPHNPRGYWEVNGFGLFGIYKSDFDRIGGMNTEEFKDRWGGEDWELLDRVLQNGLEVERLRLRNFFHYYHSKRGMWNTQSQESAVKD